MSKSQSLDSRSILDIDALMHKSKEELVRIIVEKQNLTIPISVLNSKLHPLQAVVKYLKDKENLSIKDISIILNRNIQTIWTTYRMVKDSKVVFAESKIHIPLSVLSKQKNSILESSVNYLMKFHGLSLTETASILGKSIKTVWTCKNRFMIKEDLK